MSPETEQRLLIEELLSASEFGDPSCLGDYYNAMNGMKTSQPSSKSKAEPKMRGRGRGEISNVVPDDFVKLDQNERDHSVCKESHTEPESDIELFEKRQESLQSIFSGKNRNETIENYIYQNAEKHRRGVTETEKGTMEEQKCEQPEKKQELSPNNTAPTTEVKEKKNRKARNAMLNALLARKQNNVGSVEPEKAVEIPPAQESHHEDRYARIRAWMARKEVPNYFEDKTDVTNKFSSLFNTSADVIECDSTEYYDDSRDSTPTTEFTDASSGLASTSPSLSKYQDCHSSSSSSRRKISHKTSQRRVVSEASIGFPAIEKCASSKAPARKVMINKPVGSKAKNEDYCYKPDIRSDAYEYRSTDFPPLSNATTKEFQ